jgi:hypothetical protein
MALGIALAALGLLAFQAPPRATASEVPDYHLIKIRAIYEGYSPQAAFIELQMYADGQDTNGSLIPLTIYNANGLRIFSYTGGAGVPTSLNQRTVLFRDYASHQLADIYVDGLGNVLKFLEGGGAACWDVVDCVSWGAYKGTTPSPTGTPIQGGLSEGFVSVRTIARGCPTLLDEPDDTNDSNSDFGNAFVFDFPARMNSDVPSETACPPTTSAPPTKKCKKHKKSAASAKKKKCRRHKKR